MSEELLLSLNSGEKAWMQEEEEVQQKEQRNSRSHLTTWNRSQRSSLPKESTKVLPSSARPSGPCGNRTRPFKRPRNDSESYKLKSNDSKPGRLHWMQHRPEPGLDYRSYSQDQLREVDACFATYEATVREYEGIVQRRNARIDQLHEQRESARKIRKMVEDERGALVAELEATKAKLEAAEAEIAMLRGGQVAAAPAMVGPMGQTMVTTGGGIMSTPQMMMTLCHVPTMPTMPHTGTSQMMPVWMPRQ